MRADDCHDLPTGGDIRHSAVHPAEAIFQPPAISFDRFASSEHAGCQIQEGLQRINTADRTS
jgi:hypothetical protein